MAYTAGNLTLLSHGNGFHLYYYDGGSDTLATIMGSGYFNNTDDDLNLGVDDMILAKGADGFQLLRVDTVSSGAVNTELGVGESQWIPVRIASLAASTSHWAVAPFDGYIRRVKHVLEGAVSDDTAVGIELGGTDVTGAQLTIESSGSAAGDVDEGAATALNTISEGDAIEVTCDGAGSTASAGLMLIEVVPG